MNNKQIEIYKLNDSIPSAFYNKVFDMSETIFTCSVKNIHILNYYTVLFKSTLQPHIF